jgi:HlyD family secretion protein
VIEDGRLAQRRVRFAARLNEARLAITDGLPAETPVAVRVQPGFAVGRAARPVAAP